VREVGEVVELARDCELGTAGERAVVLSIQGPAGRYMTLAFPGRGSAASQVHTGSDYRYLRRIP
jgi:hypothetical protein